jgi:hypothetical protein
MPHRRQSDSLPLQPAELTTAGQALYGPQWRQGLARDLEIEEYHLIEMEAGARLIPPWVRGAVVALAQARAALAMDIGRELIMASCPHQVAVA